MKHCIAVQVLHTLTKPAGVEEWLGFVSCRTTSPAGVEESNQLREAFKRKNEVNQLAWRDETVLAALRMPSSARHHQQRARDNPRISGRKRRPLPQEQQQLNVVRSYEGGIRTGWDARQKWPSMGPSIHGRAGTSSIPFLACNCAERVKNPCWAAPTPQRPDRSPRLLPQRSPGTIDSLPGVFPHAHQREDLSCSRSGVIGKDSATAYRVEAF